MKHNKEYIEQLLQQFTAGQTTEHEEQILADYFSQEKSIPEEWEAYRELFASFSTDAYDFSNEEMESFIREKPKKGRIIRFWPYIAAACVAGVLMVMVAPPKEEAGRQTVAKVDTAKVAPQPEMVKDDIDQSLTAKVETKEQTKANARKSHSTPTKRVVAKSETLVEVQTNEVVETKSTTQAEQNLVAEAKPSAKPKARVISDRDLPITRPENMKYTKEELAILKKQADEAYLKWVELELEIAKYNQEQTALNK